MNIDEELTLLETQLRRLKIEYEVFFSNPTKKPPTDVEWKVLGLLRKFSDGGRMSFTQRFRYNEMAQRYAVYSDLWRKKGRIREEGYRRPQDAILSVRGVRPEERQSERKVYGVSSAVAGLGAATAQAKTEPVSIQCSDPHSEPEKVGRLYEALITAKKNAGESVAGNVESFASFVQKKTDQIRKQYQCQSVEFTVELQAGQVRLKAKAKA